MAEAAMTPFARYCEILEAKLSERIPDEPEKKREVCKRMRREGIAVIELSRRFGVSRQTIRDWCIEKKRAFRHSEETKARYRQLRAQGLSTRKAAAAVGVGRGTVMDWEYRGMNVG